MKLSGEHKRATDTTTLSKQEKNKGLHERNFQVRRLPHHWIPKSSTINHRPSQRLTYLGHKDTTSKARSAPYRPPRRETQQTDVRAHLLRDKREVFLLGKPFG